LCHNEELKNIGTKENEVFWLESMIREVVVEEGGNRKTQFGVFFELFINWLIVEKKKRCLILFDCETIMSQFMVGVSCPSIEGITKDEYVEMMEVLGENYEKLSGLLVMNYNPTVEAKISAEFLVYGMLY